MSCEICCEKEKAYEYILNDSSSVDICHECAGIVYGKIFEPIIPDRLHHLAILREYLEYYKTNFLNNKSEVIEIKKDIMILKKAM